MTSRSVLFISSATIGRSWCTTSVFILGRVPRHRLLQSQAQFFRIPGDSGLRTFFWIPGIILAEIRLSRKWVLSPAMFPRHQIVYRSCSCSFSVVWVFQLAEKELINHFGLINQIKSNQIKSQWAGIPGRSPSPHLLSHGRMIMFLKLNQNRHCPTLRNFICRLPVMARNIRQNPQRLKDDLPTPVPEKLGEDTVGIAETCRDDERDGWVGFD